MIQDLHYRDGFLIWIYFGTNQSACLKDLEELGFICYSLLRVPGSKQEFDDIHYFFTHLVIVPRYF